MPKLVVTNLKIHGKHQKASIWKENQSARQCLGVRRGLQIQVFPSKDAVGVVYTIPWFARLSLPWVWWRARWVLLACDLGLERMAQEGWWSPLRLSSPSLPPLPIPPHLPLPSCRQRWQLEGASLRGRQGQEDVGEEGSAAVPDEDGHHRRRQRVPDRRPTRRDEEGRERRRQIPAGPRSPERSLPR